MKERLIQLLDMEQLSPSKFADIIGVQRSSISHVISGRNKPSFDFIQKTLTSFPGLNAEWLILGNGTMYEQMGRATTGNLFEAAEPPRSQFPDEKQAYREEAVISKDSQWPYAGTVADPNAFAGQEITGGQDPVPPPLKKVVQVMVFYDDDTFRFYRPSQ